MVCTFRESDKHALCDVLGEVRVTNHTPRGGIDEIHVAPHQLVEGGFRTTFSVGLQQLRVGLTIHSLYVSRSRENRTGKEGVRQPRSTRTDPEWMQPFLSSRRKHDG